VFGGILAPVLMLVGLKIAPAASVSLWLNLEIVATALIAISYFGNHLDGRGCIGVVLIALAGVLLAAPRAFSGFPAAALVAAACVCWSIDNNLTAIINELTPRRNLPVGICLSEFACRNLPGLEVGCRPASADRVPASHRQ
jgi:drug/metabolite transporter (DMT)-like permease